MHPLKKTQRWLLKRGFSEFKPSAGFMAELAQLPENGRRGIYVHAMKDGTEFYAGLSIDVVERYQQHLQTYGTIEHSAFLPVPEEPLEPLEAAVIDDLRRIEVTLLNVLIPSELKGEGRDRDSDDVEDGDAEDINDAKWDAWTRELGAYQDFGATDYSPADLPKFARRHADLLAHPGYSSELADFVGYFIRKVLPAADRTQGKLWSLNCLTESYRSDSAITMFRLTVHRPEILAIHHCKSGEDSSHLFMFTIHKGGLDHQDIEALSKLDGVGTYEEGFKTARFPHFQMQVTSLASAWKVLAVPGILIGLRKCAVELMRAGKLQPRIAQAHCLPVCRDIFSTRQTPPPSAGPASLLTAAEVMASPGADSAWLSDEEYANLMSALLAKAAAGDAMATGELVRHASRHKYRASAYELMERLTEEAIELQSRYPEAWKAMKALARCATAEISSKAAYAACLIRPLENGGRMTMVREFLSEFRDPLPALDSPSGDELADMRRAAALRHQGSILSGIMHTGDEEALEVAEAAWQKLDSQAKLAFFETSPDEMTFSYLSFVLVVLEETKDNPQLRRAIVEQLSAPGGLVHPIIKTADFNFGQAEGDHHHAFDPDRWSYFADYAEENAEVLAEIGEKMGDSDAIQEIIDAWAEWTDEATADDLPDEYFTKDSEDSSS